jgi:hypothetical protein
MSRGFNPTKFHPPVKSACHATPAQPTRFRYVKSIIPPAGRNIPGNENGKGAAFFRPALLWFGSRSICDVGARMP